MSADGLIEPQGLEGAEPAPAGTTEERYSLSPDLVMLAERPDVRAEAIRALRTHVVAQHIHAGRRALAVCAASDGVGCTFIAANLAVALSQIGVKTLLIDSDLHEPGVDRLITPGRPTAGLAQFLASSAMNFSEAIHAEILPDLHVMFAGGPVANAQELLAGQRFRDLMEFCLRDFDATIIDTAPANRWSDARRVSTVAGYSLIVAARDKTFVEDIKILTGQLRDDHALVIGTVLNGA